MILSNDFYYCKTCKKVVNDLDDLLFVEEGSSSCFCSEQCIEKFYTPLVDFFSGKIDKLRKDLNIVEEPCMALLENPAAVEKALSRPDEIWHVENELNEEFYTYISHQKFEGKKVNVIVICFIFNKSPSFVLAMTATVNDFFLQKFQVGDEIDSIDDFYKQQVAIEPSVDAETLEVVELKKSQILANIMEQRKEVDIDFVNFEIYVDYMAETLQNADEVYLHEDEDGDELRIFIKAHQKDGVSFFYIIICFPYSIDDENETVIPILSFPTIDGDLYEYFRKGKQVHGGLIN